MKIFANNKVYVQNNDLSYLLHNAKEIPASIFEKVFTGIFIVTDKNRYEFIEFSKPEEIEFFKKSEWIVDYNSLDGMNEEQIIEYGQQINKKRNQIAESFNKLSKNEREKQYDEITSQIDLLEFQMLSVRDILWHKQGNLEFSLPEGTNASYLKKGNITKTEEDQNNVEDNNAKKEKGLRKVFSMFKRK